jgi:hypothetical protein
MGVEPAPGLSARLLEHPRADRRDEPGLLRQRDELVRRDLALVGMDPAHQRLGPRHPSVGHCDDRLVVHGQLATVDSAPQRGLRLVADTGPHPQLLVEHLDPSAAALLGSVHGGIRVAQRGVGVVSSGGQPHADAHPDEHLARVEQEGRADGLGDALAHQPGLDLVGQTLADDHELVTAEAGDGVARADDVAQAGGNGAEELVPRCVTAAVIEHLEVVEIEEEHGDEAVVAPAAGQGLLQAVEEEGAVGQAGQHVVQRLVGELLLASFAGDGDLDEVGHAVEQPQILVRRLAGRGRIDRERGEHGTGGRVGDGQGPTRAKAGRSGELEVVSHEGITGDVLDDDALDPMGGGAAGALALGDGDAVDRGDHVLGQRRRGRHTKDVVLHDHDRAQQIGSQRLHQTRDGDQGLADGRPLRDELEDVGVAVEEHRGLFARRHVAGDDLHGRAPMPGDRA